MQTWTEIHRGPFTEQAGATLARWLQPLTAGPRRSECFLPMDVAQTQRRSEGTHHLHMSDPGFVERRAALDKAGAQVKTLGRELGVEQHLAVP
jgi:hypothetical protein